MRWQRNVFHKKEQDKTPEGHLNEIEIGSLKKEFWVMVIKKIQELGKKMDIQIEKLQEVLSKEVEKYYTKQWKSTITAIKTY